MSKNKNLHYIFFFIIYLIVGSYLSVTNGITSDEYIEELNWQINISAVSSFFKNGNFAELLNYGDRYHGIAFHYISQPIQFVLHQFVAKLNDLNTVGGYLITKHLAVFLLFSVSGVSFYLLSFKLTKNISFSFILRISYCFLS